MNLKLIYLVVVRKTKLVKRDIIFGIILLWRFRNRDRKNFNIKIKGNYFFLVLVIIKFV